ncbi:MAG TPA: hypothetical protein VE685_18820 [Thermoanaerobaculia bacterium]|nr:hypothetical protein [Thermoanaerobaculia bacterium]
MSDREYTECGDIDSRIYENDDIPQEERTPNTGDDFDAAPENPEALEALEAFDLEADSVDQWRVAKSLLVLRDQVNRKAPGRNKDSDGTIGDIIHQGRASDHNPWVRDGGVGVVTALDITHDPRSGCDAGVLAESIRGSLDARVKYIIWNRRIANSSSISGQPPWAWRPYNGRNPHDKHVHISVKSEKPSYDSEAAWAT